MEESILKSIVRIGTVTDVDSDTRKVRVKFQDTGITSAWLFVLQHSGCGVGVAEAEGHTHGASVGVWMPAINMTVLCLYLPVFNADGFVIGGIS